MIEKLRRRMTLGSLAALLLILAGVIAAINLSNGYLLRQQTSQALDMLLSGNADELAVQDSGRTERPGEGGRWDPSGLPQVRAASLARVSGSCTIRLNREGQLHEWQSNTTGLYDDQRVQELLEAIQQDGGSQGRFGDQVWRKEERSYGWLIVCLDIASEMAYAQTLLRITVVVGAAALVLLGIGAVLLIRKALLPVQQAFAKQQQFVWDASHELKTPLAVIATNAQVLEKECGENEYLGYIQSEVRSANQLVQNLLTLARMDAGKSPVAFARFDLGQALLQAALPLESLAFEKGKVLETHVAEGMYAYGNQELVQQLTVILLSNAIQYAGPGGTITLSLETHGRQRWIRVHNTGSYISPQDCQRIFDRFYRAEDSHSRETGGSGLGLSIAQSIIQLHKGRIFVESDPASGTRFTAVLMDSE